MPQARADTQAIVVNRVETQTIRVTLIGSTPIILNRMSEKARRTILFPSGPKTQAERASSMKHDPMAEFRDSPERMWHEEAPTLLAIPGGAIKGALMTAALDLPGAKKTQIGRLVTVMGEMLPVWGIPHLFMSVVRSADMNRTPDVRTRVIIPRWVTQVDIRFVTPLIRESSIVNLLAGAGETCGVGDWRQEKGKGSYGGFEIANPDDAEVAEIMAAGGRAAQVAAMDAAAPYDRNTAELLEWFTAEMTQRNQRAISEPGTRQPRVPVTTGTAI